MFTHCIHCCRALGANRVLPTFPVGRRLAFDSRRGRLWVVCPACQRWNLTPLEERWEAVEEAERLVEQSPQVIHGEEISLARVAEGVELIRVGRANQQEIAAWRYGRVFAQRHRRHMVMASVGAGGLAAAVLLKMARPELFSFLSGIPSSAMFAQLAYDRWKHRWRVVSRIEGPDGSPLAVRASEMQTAKLVPALGEGFELEFQRAHSTIRLEGARAEGAIRRIFVALNDQGGDKKLVDGAVREVAAAKSAQGFLARLAKKYHDQRGGKPKEFSGGRTVPPETLYAWTPSDRLAFEMALHDESERALAAGELAALTDAWREAEEIAAIADNLLAFRLPGVGAK